MCSMELVSHFVLKFQVFINMTGCAGVKATIVEYRSQLSRNPYL